MLEVLDANIVIILEEPLAQTVNTASLLEESELAPLMRKPLTLSQGLSLDLGIGAPVGTHQIESMRSQKTISLSPLRIEVHDRSGEANLEKGRIPETMVALANALHIGRIKAIGTNWEVLFKSQEKVPASVTIAEKLLLQDISFLPQNMKPIGGSVQMFLTDPSDVVYMLAIEPRGQNALTDELRMLCNANINTPEALSVELLKKMFQHSYHLLFDVKKSLFPVIQS
jgi:hypothetical protein